MPKVRFTHFDVEDAKRRVQNLESKYGVTSEHFVDAFRDDEGQLEETEDFFEWSYLVSALKIAGHV